MVGNAGPAGLRVWVQGFGHSGLGRGVWRECCDVLSRVLVGLVATSCRILQLTTAPLVVFTSTSGIDSNYGRVFWRLRSS